MFFLTVFFCSLSGKEHSVFTGVAVVLCHKKESKFNLLPSVFGDMYIFF